MCLRTAIIPFKNKGWKQGTELIKNRTAGLICLVHMVNCMVHMIRVIDRLKFICGYIYVFIIQLISNNLYSMVIAVRSASNVFPDRITAGVNHRIATHACRTWYTQIAGTCLL